MFKINKNILLVLGSVIIVLGLAWFIFDRPNSGPIPANSNNTFETGNNVQKNSAGAIIEPLGDFPLYSGRPVDEIKFGQGFSASQAVIDQKSKELKVLAIEIEKNPAGRDNWMAIAIIKKFFNDYIGARDAWEYVVALYPNDSIAWANLGNVYAYYLKDNIKAESAFKKSIAYSPYEPSYYIDLAEFYKLFDTKNLFKIPEVISAGLTNVHDVNLYLYLAGYYADIGNNSEAIKYYRELLKIAPDSPGIQGEIDRLSW